MATVTGSSGNDTLSGGTERDSVYGYSGNDSLHGGRGSDTIRGGDGNDVLTGDSGSGAETLLLGSSITADAGSYKHSSGWTSQNQYPRQLGDVNGDGRADIIAISSNNVHVGLGQADGTFAFPILGQTGFAYNDGWTSQEQYPRLIGDVNGDGRADLVGMSGTAAYVALGQTNGTFGSAFVADAGNYSHSLGWTSQNRYPRQLGDVNGDGRADLIAISSNDVCVGLGQADGTFAYPIIAHTWFASNDGWSSFGLFPRLIGDVNGDGLADLVAMGTPNVYVALGQANGTFGTAFVGDPGSYSHSLGWTSQNLYPRQLGDVNGDGRADLIAISGDNVYAGLGQADGTFAAPVLADTGYAYNDGWTSQDLYPRLVGDVNGDGWDELVVMGSTSVYSASFVMNGDELSGEQGDDTLDGGAGADTLAGGGGNDVYLVGDAADVVVEAASEGTDEVRTALSAYTLATNVENLTYTGAGDAALTGNGANNLLSGGAGADTLSGDSGNDTLSGGAGADVMAGGIGNDTYQVDDAGDVVTENAGEGTDTVRSSLTHTLGATLENLALTGSAAIDGFGNGANNAMTGNGAANRLEGYAGNDTLNGGGGADTLVGGTGNDTYSVDNAGDVLVELAGEGTDTVRSTVTWTLAAEFEHLTLTGGGAVNGTGNAEANILIGNGAANRLQGLDGNDTLSGGAGDDTLEGGAGDDVHIVDSGADVVVELAGGGLDSVRSSATFALSAEVETLTLTGSAAIDGTGNDLANTITGNAGANVLDGGLGADTMTGGAGDDTYVVDDAGDVVSEAAGGGADTVRSTLSHALAAEVESLVLEGGAAIDGTGNALDNTLTGNGAENVLNGGAGSDTLTGGAGNDLFTIASPAEGGDVVTDFTAGEDRIAVLSPNFGNVPAGALSASNFALDAAADGDDWFVFNTASGVLSFDADGSGAGAAVTLATLNVTTLSASDITVLAAP
ncbi:MAG TPA: FG-GAP-like repeat-containing protein [Azospirillum sp.]